VGGGARLLAGPLAAIVFAIGVAALPAFIPGYNGVRQTVSEIGETSSPMRWPFAALLWSVGACVLVFASALWSARPAARALSAAAAAICTAWMGLAAAAIGWFAYPHPLHNGFGLSELLGYQAPLAFAIGWRGQARAAVGFSLFMYALTLASLGLNLSVMLGGEAWWGSLKPFSGLVQRSLFAGFFLWCAGAGGLLWMRTARATKSR
jgi:hypothetical membrane protein